MIGDRIQEIITAKGITQEELSRGTGLSLGQVNRIIKGKSAPTSTSLTKIIKYLDVPMNALYSDDPRATTLASKMLERLPDDIVKAIGDERKIEYLILGLKLSDSELSKDEIEYIVNQYRDYKEKFK